MIPDYSLWTRPSVNPSTFASEQSRDETARLVRKLDPKTLAQVMETYLPQVLRAARGAGLAPAEAEEVTQETFVKFLEIAPRFEGRSHVRTFLFGILYRKISESRRDNSRARLHDPIDDVMEDRFASDGSWSHPPASAESLIRTKEVRKSLDECLSKSPEPQRIAFHLKEVEGLDRAEICKILEVTSTNLDVMLYRLRNRTRECLESRSVGSTL